MPVPVPSAAALSKSASARLKSNLKQSTLLVGRSGGSTTSAISAMLVPYKNANVGGGDNKKRQVRLAPGVHEEDENAGGGGSGGGAQRRISVVVAAGDDDDDSRSVHHSFASFVSRRSMAGKSDFAGPSGGASLVGELASRAHSVVDRIHSSLVAAGRLPSITAQFGPGHRLSRFHGPGAPGAAAGAAGSGGGAGAAGPGSPTRNLYNATGSNSRKNRAGEATGARITSAGPTMRTGAAVTSSAGRHGSTDAALAVGAGEAEVVVSPGLPVMSAEETAAAGAASAHLGDGPRAISADGGPLSAGTTGKGHSASGGAAADGDGDGDDDASIITGAPVVSASLRASPAPAPKPGSISGAARSAAPSGAHPPDAFGDITAVTSPGGAATEGGAEPLSAEPTDTNTNTLLRPSHSKGQHAGLDHLPGLGATAFGSVSGRIMSGKAPGGGGGGQGGGRRSMTETGGEDGGVPSIAGGRSHRAMTASQLMMRGSLSKKALLAQVRACNENGTRPAPLTVRVCARMALVLSIPCPRVVVCVSGKAGSAMRACLRVLDCPCGHLHRALPSSLQRRPQPNDIFARACRHSPRNPHPQADLDLDDEEDDRYGRPPPPAATSAGGTSQRRSLEGFAGNGNESHQNGNGGGAGAGAGAGGYVSDEDTGSVGCCGISAGGNKRRQGRITPAR